MTHPAVDWPLLLEELRLSGLTFREIAKATDVSHVTLINYSSQATNPMHASGERLIAFWISRTAKSRADLPKTWAGVKLRRAS